MLHFDGTETMGNRVLNFLRYFSYGFSLTKTSIKVNSILTLHCASESVTDSSVRCDVMYRTQAGKTWRCASHAAVVKIATQYRHILDKHFNQYLVICPPGFKNVWDLIAVIPSTYYLYTITHIGQASCNTMV